MIDPDGPLRPLRPLRPPLPPPTKAGDTLAAAAARRIKRDAAFSRDTEPHLSARPEAIWRSGFAIVAARLPGRELGWVAIWRWSCGCVSHVGPHLDAINAIMFRGGVGEVHIETIQPLDPT